MAVMLRIVILTLSLPKGKDPRIFRRWNNHSQPSPCIGAKVESESFRWYS
jgi:hypothetical protein